MKVTHKSMTFLTRKSHSIFSTAILSALLAGSAHGATVFFDTAGAVKGVSGITAGGYIYDVEFVHDSFNNAYALTGPSGYLQNLQLAAEAQTSILAALNANPNALSLSGLTSTSQYFEIPYEIADGLPGTYYYYSVVAGSPGSEKWLSIQDNSVWFAAGRNGVGITTDIIPGLNIAVFTQVGEVPIPASIWLFGSSITGLLAIQRKTKTS